MVLNIISVVGLFIGISYSIFIILKFLVMMRIGEVKDKQQSIRLGIQPCTIFMAGLGWSMFFSKWLIQL